ncbi:PIG-L deacetylase family protein [Amycolatopsis pigmentata]|uniref:PIG-L deacetylase family protein n=1 Tax=Amycolatopsis pigmentata TaxID=450801 RepID=A0ABW5FJN8_9PSEU
MKVLAVGAHPDDIELGCGGALLAHKRRGDEITLLVMTDGSAGPQDSRSRLREQEDAAAMLGARLLWGGYRDNTVPHGPEAIAVVEQAIATSAAEMVYTHAPGDTHQDHRATAAAVLSASRRATRVLLYESPTSNGFTPSFFVDIEGLVEAKQDLVRAHMSQVLKNGLVDLEALEAQARYHGFRARIRHAEAFECQRFLWEFSAVESLPSAEKEKSRYRDQKELSL